MPREIGAFPKERLIMAQVRKVADPNAPLPPDQEKMRQEDNRMVKGIFIDKELKGGILNTCYRIWKGDPIRNYTLVDGQQYEIPLGFAKWLNNGCAKTKYSHITDAHGRLIPHPQKEHRFAFQSLEYT